MTDAVPITIGVWKESLGAGWEKVSEIRTWRNLSLEPRYLQPGPWSLRMPYNAQTVVLENHHLLTFDFRNTRMTGIIEKIGPRSDEETGQPMLETSGIDALSFLGGVQCWPDPASPLTTQNVVHYYANGPTETVLRNLIQANLTRRGDDIVVAPSLGRGLVTTVDEDFTNLLTVVLAKCEVARLGVRMGLVNTTSSTRAEMRVEFFSPEDKSNRVRLSHEVGTLKSWTQEDNAPTGTRVILKAAKEETAFSVASVNTTTNEITITPPDATGHRFKTGDLIRFGDVRGTPPAPLQLFQTYYAVRVDSDTFKVATTRTNASKGLAIDLTSNFTAPLAVVEITRKLREYVNTAAETAWARRREIFISANISDDDDEATYAAAGEEALINAGATSAFELDSVEAEGMRYGDHFNLGDKVTIQLLTGVTKVDELRAAKIDISEDSGLSVQLVPGNPDAIDPMFGQAKIVRDIRRAVAALERRDS